MMGSPWREGGLETGWGCLIGGRVPFGRVLDLGAAIDPCLVGPAIQLLSWCDDQVLQLAMVRVRNRIVLISIPPRSGTRFIKVT